MPGLRSGNCFPTQIAESAEWPCRGQKCSFDAPGVRVVLVQRLPNPSGWHGRIMHSEMIFPVASVGRRNEGDPQTQQVVSPFGIEGGSPRGPAAESRGVPATATNHAARALRGPRGIVRR